jgi:hypothetical protein
MEIDYGVLKKINPGKRTNRGYFFIGKIKKYGSSIIRYCKSKKGNPIFQFFLAVYRFYCNFIG